MSDSNTIHDSRRAELLTDFFSSSSRTDTSTLNGHDDASAEILLSKMQIPSFSVGYFGLLEAMGTPMDASVQSLTYSRNQFFKQKSSRDAREQIILNTSLNTVATTSSLRFSLLPEDFSDFVEYLYYLIMKVPLTDLIVVSPCSMRDSNELVFQKVNHQITLSIGQTLLKDGYFGIVASKIFFNFAETVPICAAASYMIVKLLRLLSILSDRSGKLSSQNMIQLSSRNTEPSTALLSEKRSHLKLEVKLGVCKLEDFLKYTASVHESVFNVFHSPSATAFMGPNRRLLSDLLSRSAVERIRLEICTCQHLTENIIHYLAAAQEYHSREINHHDSTCGKNSSFYSRSTIEKCCILLLFAFHFTGGAVILKQQQTLYQLYGLRVGKLVDHILRTGVSQPSVPASLNSAWTAVAADADDDTSGNSHKFILKLLLLRIHTSRLVLRWMRCEEAVVPSRSAATTAFNDTVLGSSTTSNTTSMCQHLVEEFFVLCRDVVVCGVLEDILLVFTAVLELLDSAWCVSYPRKYVNDITRCCTRSGMGRNMFLEYLFKGCEECSSKQLHPVNRTSSDQLFPVLVTLPSQTLRGTEEGSTHGNDSHLPNMKNSTNLPFHTLFDYLKGCSSAPLSNFSIFLNSLHDRKNTNLAEVMCTAITMISARLNMTR
jgi:hypothetical protein